jgi:hypothetical protein
MDPTPRIELGLQSYQDRVLTVITMRDYYSSVADRPSLCQGGPVKSSTISYWPLARHSGQTFLLLQLHYLLYRNLRIHVHYVH